MFAEACEVYSTGQWSSAKVWPLLPTYFGVCFFSFKTEICSFPPRHKFALHVLKKNFPKLSHCALAPSNIHFFQHSALWRELHTFSHTKKQTIAILTEWVNHHSWSTCFIGENVSPFARLCAFTHGRPCRHESGGKLCTHLALVQSLYRVSKSFLEMSLQRFTPGWMAPSPRRMRTCSTLHTTGVISSRFSLV